MSVVSSLLARTGLAGLFGLQANGLRDMYHVFGWKQKPEHRDFVAKYLRQDITQRIIQAPVNALWSDPPKVTSTDVVFSKAWQDLMAQIPVFHELQRVDILSGLGRYAILVIGINDGRNLDQPLANGTGRKVIYMQPYAEGSVDIKTFETNQANARFGLPVMYTVTPGNFETGMSASQRLQAAEGQLGSSFNVHWSRVLHVAEGALESKVFGHSRLEGIYNVLDDILKVTGGSAEMFWLNANRGLHVNVDKDMDLQKDDAENLSDEIDEYANQLRRVIRTRGVEVKSLGSEVSDPRGVFDVQLSLLAAQSGIPKRVLMGSEAGQLASQQDRANWSIRVEERITAHGQPTIMIPFIRMMIDSGVLPTPQNMTIEWPDAFKMNPLERAQTSAQMARSAANLSKTLKTVADINMQNAQNSQPTIVPAGGGGGLFGNADPNATKPPATKPAATPPPIEQPPLFATAPPTLVLLTEEECRSIIGFGKHMPVFDDTGDTTASGSQTSDTTNEPQSTE